MAASQANRTGPSQPGKPDGDTRDGGVSEIVRHGMELHRRARFTDAIALYREACRLNPDHPDVNHLLGLALLNRRRRADREELLKHLQHAVALKPDAAEYHNDLGNAYWNQRRIHEAAEAFQTALELKPEFVAAAYNLGNARFMQDRFEESADAYRRTIALDPGWVQAYYRMANCLYYTGPCEAALAAYDEALRRKPDLRDARFGRAMALLKLGRFSEGWRDYEYRLGDEAFEHFRATGIPLWAGEKYPGKNLLVYAEQGIGDTIQFARYLKPVLDLGGAVSLMCDELLHPLFRHSLPEVELLGKRDSGQVLKGFPFDLQVPLMTLPGIFGTTLKTVPANVPYLHVNGRKRETWRLRVDPGQFNVGLVWGGNPAQKDDRHRSCPLTVLQPLSTIPGVTFYSLQKGPASSQLASWRERHGLIDVAGGLGDFSETAALISVLDLVISVDTAAAHLAGAISRPVWTLLWHGHCWRYLLERTDSPWYPDMRLFRQSRLGDWHGVVEQVRSALSEQVSGFREHGRG